ncbi:MAG: hypothetical protein KUA37_02785 [Desulfomicrobium sp.]|nr:hypothetical protein [Pseudomonadota bacterium]MBU4570574.1 hypothetical protein [Pseudomonadota bacterium]MBU4593338.1 hypothetical protein [Pseudomonadota bacterium]MBV1710920.1 hypothetical protein [Desulfomicrobium sp.]MBV1719348.1 hypothetical protein [Desulfomicrobium sp.]
MMQENLKNKGGVKRKGVASLFDDYEIKDLFRRYIQLLIVVEVLIFLVCWVYQLGLDQVAATGTPVDVPFPWKAYFLVSFSAPVAVTFLIGIVVVAFNSFLYGQKRGLVFKETSAEGGMGKIARAANFCFQLPFLLTLLLLGIFIGVAYNIGAIMEYLARFGEAAAKVVLIGLGCALVAGTIFGVVRMVLNYKLRKKNMEYDYKREVMDRLGIAILDERTMIDSQGKVLGPKHIDVTSSSSAVLPPAPTVAANDKPDNP